MHIKGRAFIYGICKHDKGFFQRQDEHSGPAGNKKTGGGRCACRLCGPSGILCHVEETRHGFNDIRFWNDVKRRTFCICHSVQKRRPRHGKTYPVFL